MPGSDLVLGASTIRRVGIASASASCPRPRRIKSANYPRRVTAAAASMLTNYHVNDIP